MKRSRSGTAPPGDGPGLSAILLIAALAIVLAFAASLIFGLRGSDESAAVPIAPAHPDTQNVTVHASRAKVEVLNGSGKQGLARLATEQLRDAGYDVVQFGNAAKTTADSYVLDRVGRRAVAVEIGQLLGIDSTRTQLDKTRLLDATIVLGKDWPPPQKTQPAATRSWKDRLLRR